MRTIWLASYPKSGNTWFRMLIANLSVTGDEPADINDLPERGGIASARGPFDYLTLIDSGLLTPDEIDSLRPRVYERLARGEPDDEYDAPKAALSVRFVKAHDAYTLTPLGEPLLAGRGGADGAILIVRDPRDVVLSLANHLGATIDRTIAFLNNREAGFCTAPANQHSQLRQRLLSWSGHTASWLEQTGIPVHLIRYEDMQADVIGVLARALAFAKRDASEEAVRRAVALASFGNLQRQEAENGFAEAPRKMREGLFFRRGEAGAWRKELDPDQVARIEAAHAPMMERLGYPVVELGNAARNG